MKNKLLFEKSAAILLALAVWQVAAMLLNNKILLVSPVSVLARLAVIWREPGFFASVWFSFSRIVGGFFAALVAGVALALLAGRVRLAEILLRPYMVSIKSVPVASFVVLALIILSSRQLSVFVSFLIVLPVIYTNVLNGIRSLDPKLLEAARLFGTPARYRLLYIWLPGIKPYLLSACGIAIGLAWKSGVAAEVIGIPDGSIGEALYNSKVYLNTADLFAWTVIIVLLSVLFEKLFVFLLRKCIGGLEKL